MLAGAYNLEECLCTPVAGSGELHALFIARADDYFADRWGGQETVMRKVRARKAARSGKSRNGSSAPGKRPAGYAGRDRQPQGGRGTTPESPVSADARELDDPGRPVARFAHDGVERQGWGALRDALMRDAGRFAPRRLGSLPDHDGVGNERAVGFAGRMGNYAARFEAGQLAGIGLSGSVKGDYVGWGRHSLVRSR